MRLVGRQRGLIFGMFVGAFAGCFFEASPQQRQEDVCTAYCQCFVGPTQVAECVQECVPDLPPVNDECLDCVHLNSQTCSALSSMCTDLCVDESP